MPPQDSKAPGPPPPAEQHGGYWDSYWDTLNYGQLPLPPPPPHVWPAGAYDHWSTHHKNNTRSADGDDIKNEPQKQPPETWGATITGVPDEHHRDGVAAQTNSSEVAGRNILAALNRVGVSDAGGGGGGGGGSGADGSGENLAGGDTRLEESETVIPISESVVFRASGNEESLVGGQEGDVEGEDIEEVGLVMSPEWAEHLRNSPTLQRYRESYIIQNTVCCLNSSGKYCRQ